MPEMSIPVSSEAERVAREHAFTATVENLRLENLYLDDEAQNIFKRHVAGDITWDEFRTAIEELSARQFGPVPVSERRS